ncbi:hypothetical protein CFRS1_v015953 [Colletotrichum fructicola]|nr:hypothetical protein CFRS1_v015953 [Colletotrichum fructicola]
MEPFVHDTQYSILICTLCKYAVLANEATAHLRDNHRSIPAEARSRVAGLVGDIPGIIRSQADLQSFQYPDPTVEPVAHIAPPRADEKRFEADAREEVSIVDEKLEPNGWLYRVGWTRDLEGLNRTQLQEATQPIEDGEETLRNMWAVFNSVADKARATAAPHKVGHDALFEAERKEIGQKPVRPFDNRMEDDTWQRYKEVWRKMVSIWFRMDEWPERERPPYRFTMRQGSLWDAFTSRVEADVGSRQAAQAEEVERMCLDAIIAIIEDPYKQSQKESAMIGALAVLGIREDGGWHQATEYTTNYSAVIKVAKMFVVYQAWLERQDEVAALTATKGAEAAYEEASSVFHLVRDKVRRFMTRMPGRPDDEPRVMSWIYDARTYGMHIRFNTVAPGMVDWSGDRISFRRVQVRVCELAEMFHGVAQEARSLLAQLAMVDGHGDRDNDTERDGHGDGYGGRSALAAALPAIRWESMHDDHSQDRPGYSFLHDDRNEAWVGKGKGWIARRIAESEARRRAWLDPTRGTAAAAAAAAAAGEAEEEATSNCSNSHHPYRERTVQAYRQALESFRERLWMLMHMVAGQPARAPELAGIRHSNTANGGVRNVFAHDSMMCFVTSYHKNYRQTGTAKVIHRYLPREQVGGIIHQTDRKSAFLWADDVVVRGRAASDDDARNNTEDDDARDNTITDESTPATPSRAPWTDERLWTSDKARRIMQQHSERLIGSKINISGWRQMAVAIANRYLNEAFGRADDKNNDNNDNDDDDVGVEDSALDLQAGHGTHVAGMIYGRLYQEAPFGTAALRDRFRAVSRQWHRLLGFGAEDRGGGAPTKRRRTATTAADEEFEGQRRRRFTRLQLANAGGQLQRRQQVGPGGVGRVPRRVGRVEGVPAGVAGVGADGAGVRGAVGVYFSSCFHCGLPQGWCQRWEPLGEDGGRFREVEGGSCQYQGMMVAMFAVATIGVGSRVYEETVRAMRRADGLEEWASSEEEVYKWLGQMIQWGGVQSSKLCRLTSQLWQRAVEGVAEG